MTADEMKKHAQLMALTTLSGSPGTNPAVVNPFAQAETGPQPTIAPRVGPPQPGALIQTPNAAPSQQDLNNLPSTLTPDDLNQLHQLNLLLQQKNQSNSS